jgi:hypothetical protein
MSKMSLNEIPGSAPAPATPTQPVESPAATTGGAVPDMSLARQNTLNTGFVGEVTSKDLTMPRVNLVHRTSQGELAAFTPGSLVLDKSFLLANLGETLNFVVLSAKKMYQQDTAYGDDMGDVVDTVAEVVARGGSIVYGSPNFWYERVDLLMAIQKPDSLDNEALFPYEAGFTSPFIKDPMALAVITLSKSAFTSMAKPIITAAVSTLRNKLHCGVWTVKTRMKVGAKGTWPVPEARLIGILPDEDGAKLQSLLG